VNITDKKYLGQYLNIKSQGLEKCCDVNVQREKKTISKILPKSRTEVHEALGELKDENQSNVIAILATME
jgi:hypothetical protein